MCAEPIRPEYRAIYDTVRAIPPGRVSSYGRIAELAGLPRRARLVGRALRQTPAGLDLPWHRVLRADGRPAFAAGSDPYRTQLDRLREEGVAVKAGRVDFDRYGLGLDDLLWGPSAEGG